MSQQPRKRGNPEKRRRGEAVRAVIMATVKAGKPVPLTTVCSMLQVTHPTVLKHLYVLREMEKIGGYTTAGGVVRVW